MRLVLVAMPVEIHASVVGAIIAALVVLVGVVLTAWLTRRATVLDGLRRAATGYVSTMPLFMARMTATPMHAIDLTPQEVNRRLIAALAMMEQNARRLWLLLHRDEILREVKATMAQVQSIAIREM